MSNKVIFANGLYTVVTEDNQYFSGPGRVEDFGMLQLASVEEVKAYIFPEFKAKIEAREREIEEHKVEVVEMEKKIENYMTLTATGDFEFRNDSLYLVGVNRSIPETMANRFVEHFGTPQYEPMKRFWMWCCLNPRADVPDLLFQFLDRNGMYLNPNGFFYALRNVVKVSLDDTYITFITDSWMKIKKRKKGPKNYSIYSGEKDGKTSYVLIRDGEETDALGDYLLRGNLDELYQKRSELDENRYTDAHTRTFDIRIGKTVSMPYEDCSWNRADCGHSGLHWTMNEINYVGCGDTSVIILINPAKVVGVGYEKGRCYEYLPIASVPRTQATKILRDRRFDPLDMEVTYGSDQVANLEQMVRENFAKEMQKHSFNIPELSSSEIELIGRKMVDMDEAKAAVEGRVIRQYGSESISTDFHEDDDDDDDETDNDWYDEDDEHYED